MTDRNRAEVVDALVSDRAPKGFVASQEDCAVLQAAIALKCANPVASVPSRRFVEELRESLVAAVHESDPDLALLTKSDRPVQLDDVLSPRRRPARSRSRFAPGLSALGRAAAALALVAGTVAVTDALDRRPNASVALGTPSAGTVRSGQLLTPAGRVLGHTYFYPGRPSVVFVEVRSAGVTGTFECRLQLADGTEMSAGAVVLHNGTGDFVRTIGADVSQIRRAELLTPAGGLLASAVTT